MTVRGGLVVVAIMLAAGFAESTLGISPAPAFVAALVVLVAWGLVNFMQWRRTLRRQLAVRPAHPRGKEG